MSMQFSFAFISSPTSAWKFRQRGSQGICSAFHVWKQASSHLNSFRFISPHRLLFPVLHFFHATGIRTRPHCHTSCHSSCHSSHSHEPNQQGDSTSYNDINGTLVKLASLRTSIRAAIASAVLLLLSAALYVIRLQSPLIYRIPLISSLALSGLPAVADTTLTLLRNRSAALNVDVLMTLAALASVISGAFFEAALLTTLYTVSLAAEQAVSARAAAQLNTLRRATPDTALLLSKPGADPLSVPLDTVVPGNLILVQVGQIAPCDGVVIHAPALVSIAHLTGETVPVMRDIGDFIQAGTRPEDAPLIIEVTNIGSESFLARIARLVTEGQQNRPRVARFFDRFGALYTRLVLFVSLAITTLLPFCSASFRSTHSVSFGGRNGSIMRGLGLLVVASPCALLIGAPIAYTAALSSCARRGVLVKGGARAIDAASVTSHVVFDKTGTLTTGDLRLTAAHTVPADDELTTGVNTSRGKLSRTYSKRKVSSIFETEELTIDQFSRVVNVAAALERGAVHPIAKAVRQKACEVGGEQPKVIESRVVAGQGVEGSLSFDTPGRSKIFKGKLGRPSYILQASDAAFRSIAEEAALQGETVSVLQIANDRYLLRMKDNVREEAADVVQNLQNSGLRVSVLTGDANGAANFVNNALGGGLKVVSNATPIEKMKFVEELGRELRIKGQGVLMVGDGVNDGAALAAAMVGVAFGLSNATAVDAAEVVLIREDLRNLTWFLRKAKATGRIVKQNLVIAIGLMIASGVACVVGSVPLWLAVMMHEGGTILVGINGLRLLRDKNW